MRKLHLIALVSLTILLPTLVGTGSALAQTATAVPTNTPTSTAAAVVATPTGTIPTPAMHQSTFFEALDDGQVTVDPPASTGCVNVTIAGVQPGDLVVLYPPAALTTSDGATYNGMRILMNNTIQACFIITSGHPPRKWEYVWWDRTNPDKSVQPTPQSHQ